MYFTPDDWGRITETYEDWWSGKLERPLVLCVRRTKSCPQISKSTCGDFAKPPEDVIAEMDYNIVHTDYFGDAYPVAHWEFFGPGILAAYLGSPVTLRTDTVWFNPIPNESPLADMHFAYDPNNPWLVRCKDLYWAAVKKWQGKVQIGMTDIGGELDVIASLVGTERLLYSLIDEPREVKRLCEEIHVLWWKCYTDLLEIIAPTNPGHSDWLGVFSAKPYYTQQCDFSYMISPTMFGEFVAPYLRDTAARLGHSFYHLDGPGELAHLDTLLKMDNIAAIQWQPGDGNGWGYKWIEVYRKLRAAGKNMHFIGSNEEFEKVTADVGAKGMYFNTWFRSDEDRVRFFEKYGVR